MLQWSFSALVPVYLWIVDLFDVFDSAFGFWSVVMAVILSMAVIRFLIYPFLKVGVGSDSVRVKRTNNRLE